MRQCVILVDRDSVRPTVTRVPHGRPVVRLEAKRDNTAWIATYMAGTLNVSNMASGHAPSVGLGFGAGATYSTSIVIRHKSQRCAGHNGRGNDGFDHRSTRTYSTTTGGKRRINEEYKKGLHFIKRKGTAPHVGIGQYVVGNIVALTIGTVATGWVTTVKKGESAAHSDVSRHYNTEKGPHLNGKELPASGQRSVRSGQRR